MKCYNCGSFLYENDYCSVCGADVTVYRRIVKRSNLLYNEGLRFAQDRNMSAAKESLETALKAYKDNVQARNLLGLVYYETGDFTRALVQWIISTNIQPEGNIASTFLHQIRKNQSGMERINSAIRKYNSALEYVGQGNWDLAEIQLKKLVHAYPKFVKAYQLLALLLIRRNKYIEARANLRKVEKIDAGDPLTISYLAFIAEEMKREELTMSSAEIRARRRQEKEELNKKVLSGDDVIIPKSSYREHNPKVMAAVQIAIGVLIGAAVIFFLVLPAKTRSVRTEASQAQTSYQAQIEELTKQLEEQEEAAGGDASIKISNSDHLFAAYKYYLDEDYLNAAAELYLIDTTQMDANFTVVYDIIQPDSYKYAARTCYETGLTYYDDGNYDDCIPEFENAYKYDNTNADSLYYLGTAYAMTGDDTTAIEYLEELIAKFPGNDNCEAAEGLIENLKE